MENLKKLKDRFVVSSTTKHSSRFDILFRVNLEEHSLTQQTVYWTTASFFAIHFYSAMRDNQVKSFVRAALVDLLGLTFAYLSFIYMLLLLLLRFALGSFSRHAELWRRLSRLTMYLNFYYVMVVHPLFTLLSSTLTAAYFGDRQGKLASGFKTSDITANCISLLISTAFVALINSFQSSIPFRSLTAPISVVSVNLLHVLLTLTQFLSNFANESNSQDVSTKILSGFSMFTFSFCIYLSIYPKLFWNVKLNTQYINMTARLLTVQLVTLSTDGKHIFVQVIYFLLGQSFFIKVLNSLYRRSLRINVFSQEVSAGQLYIGVVILNEFLVKESTHFAEDADLQLYYAGLFEQNSQSKAISVRLGHMHMDDEKPADAALRDKINSLIGVILSRQSKDYSTLKVLSLLQLTELVGYFKGIRLLNDQMRQLRNGGLIGRFEQFQVEQLWKARLLHLDRTRQQIQSEGLPSILDLAEFCKTGLGQTEQRFDPNHLDCAKVFESASLFEAFANRVENIIMNQTTVYESLGESLLTVSASHCKILNRRTLDGRREAQKVLDHILFRHEADNLCSYLYPSIIFYLSSVKYDMETADRFVLLYKKKLTLLQASSMARRTKSSRANLEIDALTIQVSLEKETLGKIVNLSLNYQDFLGKHPSSVMLGESVNRLLPPELAARHLEALQSYRVAKVINKSRSVLMQDFENNLKLVHLTIKLAPSVSTCASAYGVMVFENQLKGPSLLLDRNLNIIATDSTFGQVLSTHQLKNSFTGIGPVINLSNLSFKFCNQVRLLQKANDHSKHTQPGQRRVPSGNRDQQLRDSLVSMLGDVLALNIHSGLVFGVGTDTPLGKAIGQDSIHARLEFLEILGEEMVKIFVSRKIFVQNQLIKPKNAPLDLTSNRMSIKGKQQLEPGSSDESDESMETNKAVKEENEQLVGFDSEQKMSVVNKVVDGVSGALGDFKDSGLQKLEWMIQPVFELLQLVSKKNAEKDIYHKKKAIVNLSGLEEPSLGDATLLENQTSAEVRELLSIVSTIQEEVDPSTHINSRVHEQVQPSLLASQQNLTNLDSFPKMGHEISKPEISTTPIQGIYSKNLIVKMSKDKKEVEMSKLVNKNHKVQKQKLKRTSISKERKADILTLSLNKEVQQMQTAFLFQDRKSHAKPVISTASFLTIGKILAQFTSIASTAGLSSSGSKKMLIKKYGARFNKGLKIINLRDILLLSFYLGIVALSSFLMLDSDFRTQWKTTRTLFSVYRGIARMDYYFRGSLRSYLEQFTLANTVIYTENWFMFVPPRVMGERLDVSKMVANNAHTVLETEDIIEHALTEVSHFKMALAQSVNEFKSDVYLKDMPDSLKDQILKTRLKIVNYNGTNAQNALSDSQVSGVTFLGIFKVVMEKFERNLIVLRPFLKGKRPKYNFNFRVVYSEFGIVAAEARFGALRNGWADSMDFHNKSLRSVNDLATETEPKNSQKKLMQLVSISASLLFLYVVLVALFIRKLSNWLLDFLTQYRNLRPEEIDLQKLVFRGRLTFFQRHRLDEQTMIKSYFKQVYSVQNIEMANLLPRKEPAKASVKPRRSGGKKNGIAFPSIVVYSVLSSLTLALVLYYVVAISKLNNSMKRAYRLMDLYTSVYERLTDSYHVYMYHSLYLTIGNYLLVDGQLLSTKLKTKGQEVPTQKLIQFLTTSQSEIDALYGSPKIDQMLFRNVCDSIPQNISRYDFFYSLCKRDRHASKGFIQFLYHQIDMMEEYRSQFDSLPIFEKSTMTTWVLFPFQTYMYKKPTYSFIVACNLVYDTVYNNLMTTGDLAIRKELLEIERLINSLISIIPPISIVIYLLLKVWLVLTTLRQDLVLCGESLFNMLPEVISQNKVICRKFSEAYSMQY